MTYWHYSLAALVLVVVLVLAFAMGAFSQLSPDEKLAKFHQSLLQRYPGVSHISAEALAALPKDKVIIFDVREQSEFDVSHLESAIHVSPGTPADDFLRDYEERLDGVKVVFYCSVGERSSKLAAAVLDATDGSDFGIVNLESGIFNWHNEQRQVFNAKGQTEKIHPFNNFWGRLLRRTAQFERG